MKIRMFNKGKGWYVSASNYKDKNDKAYMSIHFSKNHCQEPQYIDNGMGFSVQDIEIKEGIFTSYKGKLGITIFNYELLTNIPLTEEKEPYIDNFGGDRADIGTSVDIGPEDLPFY